MILDEIHLGMLNVLRADARISMTALAERLGISRANAYARMEALTQAGIIEGFAAVINPIAVGKAISALVFVSVDQSRWSEFRAHLDTLPELAYFAITTGEYDALLLVRVDDVASIHRIIVDHISTWAPVRATQTVFVMDEAMFPYQLAPNPSPPLDPASQGTMRFIPSPKRRVLGQD